MTDQYCPRTNKLRHDSEAKARRALRALRHDRDYRGQICHCTACGGWHVGRAKPILNQRMIARDDLGMSRIAQASDSFLESAEGQQILDLAESREAVRNYLEIAFLAGVDAAIEILNENAAKARGRRAG